MMKWMPILLISAVPVTAAAEAPAGPVLAKAQLEQVALTVTDLDRALTFYRDRLGLPLMFEAGEMLFFEISGTRLMLAHDAARERAARPSGIIYFHVDDFAAALARLKASNANLVGAVETVQTTGDSSLRLQQFEDPDGNMLAIMGFVPR